MGDTELDEAFPVAEGQVGLGVDIVEIARVRRILERTPSFRERVFSEEERAYCDAAANPEVHYATRFAAKDAVACAMAITEDSLRAAEKRVDPMEELSRQFKEARSMLDELDAPPATAAGAAPGTPVR